MARDLDWDQRFVGRAGSLDFHEAEDCAIDVRCGWVLASNVISKHNDKQEFLDTVGHEIGHILFGAGHSDEKFVSNRGVAPLPETDHRKRLMCKGANSTPNSRLTVKAEWDEAEEELNKLAH